MKNLVLITRSGGFEKKQYFTSANSLTGEVSGVKRHINRDHKDFVSMHLDDIREHSKPGTVIYNAVPVFAYPDAVTAMPGVQFQCYLNFLISKGSSIPVGEIKNECEAFNKTELSNAVS